MMEIGNVGLDIEITVDDIREFKEFKQNMELAFEKYETLPAEELDKHLADDVEIYKSFGLNLLSEIARLTRDFFRIYGIREFSDYKEYVNNNLSTIYVCYKRYAAM